MIKNLKRATGSLLLVISLQYLALGQETAIFQQPEQDYRLASDLFLKKHYASARQIYRSLGDQQPLISDDMLARVAFYDAVSAAELTNADAPAKINDFFESYPENALTGEASYYLGKIYFRDNKYKDAIKALQGVETASLSRESREELYFMMGYAQLKTDNVAAAKGNFQRITNQNSPYYGQAKYFLGHIDYLQGNYQQALKAFEPLENDRRYQKIIPIYKIQIYHYLGDYARITELGPALVESSATTNKAEIARITGNAFFNQGDYEKAAYYLDIFERTSRHSLSREDQYLLGFVDYLAGDYKGAISNFQKAIEQNDALSQNAYYYLGVCYNQTGQKKYAANAFLSAYKAGFDEELSEESLFNYIKISLETPFNPYSEAITLLESYLKDHPSSPRSDEGYGYLSRLYLSSKNYKQALQSMETIGSRNTQLETAYQKILFYRAAELFNASDLEGALELYKKASMHNYDETIKAEALYWSGEIFYRQENYRAAIKYYKDFLGMKQAKNSPFYSNAYYNLGYAYFNQEEYAEAISQFNKFLESGQTKDKGLVSDTYLRLGDAYFISNQYDRAIANYDKVIAARDNSMDYALYYKALSAGAKGDFNQKTDVLKVLINNYPKSGYADDALFETAMAYILLNQENQALTYFDRLIQGYPGTTKATQAWLRKGFIFYNRDDNAQAINAFKYVVEKYPGSQEAQEALAALKNIYVETGDIEQYYAFARNLSFAAVDVTEEDSLNFVVAENLYMQGRCDQSVAAFQKYLDKFPSGAFVTNALYYQAECNLKSGKRDEALKGYLRIAERPRSRFTETSLAIASSMEYAAKNYSAALPLYEQLETVAEDPENQMASLTGQMKCHLMSKSYFAASGAAQKLISTPGVPQEILNEAHFALGHSYLAQENLADAAAEFKQVSKLSGTEIGADASYQLAWISFMNGQMADTEDQIYALEENYAAFDYWVAKGFILLSDVFLKNDNSFQAKQTLQSVIDNYSGPELGEIARNKLAAIENN